MADQVQMNDSEPNQMNVFEPNYVDVAPLVTDPHPDQMNLDELNPLIITGTKRKFTEFNENSEVFDELNDKAAKRSFNNHPNAPTFDVQDEEQVSENQVQEDTSVQEDQYAPAPDDQPVEVVEDAPVLDEPVQDTGPVQETEPVQDTEPLEVVDVQDDQVQDENPPYVSEELMNLSNTIYDKRENFTDQ